MQNRTDFLARPDGARVFLQHWMPEPGVPVRGVFQVVHGLAEHVARYARFANALTDAGFAVFGSDHRGHGRTAPTPADLGHMADAGGFDKVTGDLLAVGELARAAHPDVPFFLFGHSMGSTYGMHLLHRRPEPVRAAIFTGPTGQVGAIRKVGRVIAAAERLRVGREARSKLLHLMSFGEFNKPFRPARTEMDWLSRDPAEVDKYVADAWCGFRVSTQFWCDFLDGMEAMYADAFVERMRYAPQTLVLAGEADPAGGMAAQVRPWVARLVAAGAPFELETYPGARHELLNEINREEVTARILGWVEARLAAA